MNNEPVAPPDTHILIVDDDERIRGLLKTYLIRQGYFVSAARDAAQARRLLGGLDFDIAVVDVMMPGEDGLSLTRHLRETGDTPVLLLTARGETSDRIAGLEAGADDYLAKPFEPRELLLRIAAVLRRRPKPGKAGAGAHKLLHLGAARYDVERGELWIGSEQVRLTATEEALLRIFSARPNEPVSRQQLIDDLGRSGEKAQERTVDVQITRLRRKLELDPKSPRHLQTVRGSGYMLVTD